MSYNYVIPEKLDFDGLIGPLTALEDRLARLDERVRLSPAPLAAGIRSRLLYHAAAAAMLAEGSLIYVEDLSLLDAAVFSGAVSPDLSAAFHVLGVWRTAASEPARQMLLSDRPGETAPRMEAAGGRPDAFYDADWDGAARLLMWRRVFHETNRLPPALAAAVGADAWQALMPEQRGAWKCSLLASLVLTARGKLRNLLLPVGLGFRKSSLLQPDRSKFEERLLARLDWMATATDRSVSELDRLVLAHNLLETRLAGRRRTSPSCGPGTRR